MFFWIALCLIGLGHGVSTQCTSSGRFPNENVEGCRGYTTCIAIGSTFYQYDLACPAHFIYNHFDNQCTNATSYYCYPQFNCNDIGYFPDPNSVQCTSYIACIQTLSTISARLVDCPANTVFDPMQETCVADNLYVCPKALEKPVSTTTLSSSPIITQTESNAVNVGSSSTKTPQGNRSSFVFVQLTLLLSCLCTVLLII